MFLNTSDSFKKALMGTLNNSSWTCKDKKIKEGRKKGSKYSHSSIRYEDQMDIINEETFKVCNHLP